MADNIDNILDSFDYYLLLDAALEQKIDAVLSNGKPEHARFIIQRFLEHADTTVRLVSGKLTKVFDGVNVYGHEKIKEAAKKFLRREGTQLSILLQEGIDAEGENAENHPLVQEIRALEQRHELEGKLEIRKASDEDVANYLESEFPYHWMVMDKDAYRLETDCEQAKASVNFGDPRMAEGLAEFFDRMFDRGTLLISLPVA